jgi:signal transduction histidine kinase/DNA-binding response OmpR family regulator
MNNVILSMKLQQEQDIVPARQRARQVAALLGFDTQDQTRLATAVSEVVRESIQQLSSGRLEFRLEGSSAPQLLCVCLSAQGGRARAFAQSLQEDGGWQGFVGLASAQRLVDRFQVQPTADGLLLCMRKLLPKSAPFVTTGRLTDMVGLLARQTFHDPVAEVQRQNQELLQTLETLRERQEDLERLNRELEDTNRGVVALYAELDEKADHLRRADEMKSRFLSNMSHEFRTPLNSILALTRLLLDRLDGDLSSEQEKQVTFIRKAATDLSELVNDLLDLAKIEAGKIEVRPTVFEVSTLFSSLRGMLRPLLVGASVDLIFEEPEGVPLLYSDESKVSQILRNFLSNALKFTERGEVRVTANLCDNGQAVCFAVSDTGIGIAPEHQAQIFAEFIQLENPLQKRSKGTGLGLPLCRKLADLLGGTVSVTSAPSIGSTFRVILPLSYREERSDEPVASEAPPPLDPLQPVVMVVEDQEELLFVYERYLANSGFGFLPARTVREARRHLERLRPYAILLDILLPDESSWGLLAELKNNPATATIPVLVATTETDQQKGLALGADAYGSKPITREWLLAQLVRVAPEPTVPLLLVEDQAEMRYLFQKLLTGTPYQLVEAINGVEGLHQARQIHPQVICLDLMLPELDGFTVLEQLKADPLTQAIPVIIVTAKTLTEAEEQRLLPHAMLLSKTDLSQAALLTAIAQVRRVVR